MNIGAVPSRKQSVGGHVQRQIFRLLDPYYLLLFVGFFYQTILFYVTWVLNKVPFGDIVSPFVTPVLVCAGVAMYCSQNSLKAVVNRRSLMFVILVAAAVCVSMLVHPETQDVVLERYVSRTLITCIPYFALGLILRGDEDSFDFLGFWSKVAVVVGMAYLYYLLNFGNPEALGDDNMGLAYNYLYVVSLVVLDVFRKPSVSGVICTAIGVVMVISLGTRGPVLLLLVFFGACLLHRIFSRRPVRVLAVTAVVGALLMVTFFFEPILQWLIELVEDLGLSTRVLEQMLEDSVLESDERGSIASLLWEKIMENPFWGYGVAGEWQFVNWNAHNMYVSFWVHFGLFFGTAGILGLVIVALRSLWIARGDRKRLLLVLMLICWIFPKGFFAGEPLSMEVFLLIGVAFRLFYEEKERQKLLPFDQRRKR